MKYNKKHSKEFEFCSTGKKNKFKLVKYCEWDDCDEKGKYKAPKNRNLPREFHWFCFKHIKLYNEEWDYFANCSRIEIETELKRDVTWHRPTWPMGYDRTTYKIENDEHNFLNDKNCDNSNKNQNSFDKKDNLTEAYASLGLKKDSSLLEIKRRYKTLVKKYHPDKNHNKNYTSDRLIKINEAYSNLIKNFN